MWNLIGTMFFYNKCIPVNFILNWWFAYVILMLCNLAENIKLFKKKSCKIKSLCHINSIVVRK